VSGAPELLLIKLGGSIVTHKQRPRTVQRQRLQRLAGELASALARSDARVVLGHGSGSFGHVVAAEYGVHEGIDDAGGARGAALTQREAGELHRIVIDALLDAGVPAWSVSPSSAMVTEHGQVRSLQVEPVRLALDAGLVPVTHGDVVLDEARGSAICSTETALVGIASRLIERGLRPTRALWLGDTDGVWDADGRTIPAVALSDRERLEELVGGARATDVTGGMRHRLDATFRLAELGIDSWILDGRRQGVLSASILGRPPGGTRVTA
jgi:isopentenyl phosphate kinase